MQSIMKPQQAPTALREIENVSGAASLAVFNTYSLSWNNAKLSHVGPLLLPMFNKCKSILKQTHAPYPIQTKLQMRPVQWVEGCYCSLSLLLPGHVPPLVGHLPGSVFPITVGVFSQPLAVTSHWQSAAACYRWAWRISRDGSWCTWMTFREASWRTSRGACWETRMTSGNVSW